MPANTDLESSGTLSPVGPGGGRRFPRYYFRTLGIATIHPPVGCEDKPQVCYVMTRDLSRGGISILHPTPLFESQRIDLELSDGRKFALAIKWVRQLNPKSYWMGCRFVEINK